MLHRFQKHKAHLWEIVQIGLCHILMPYASFVIIWHLMSNDAYDTKMWQHSIWPILVSNKPCQTQQWQQLIIFWLKKCIKIVKLTKVSIYFPFMISKNPLFQPKVRWNCPHHDTKNKLCPLKSLICIHYIGLKWSFKNMRSLSVQFWP